MTLTKTEKLKRRKFRESVKRYSCHLALSILRKPHLKKHPTALMKLEMSYLMTTFSSDTKLSSASPNPTKFGTTSALRRVKPLPCLYLRQRAKGLPKEYLSSICLIRINSLLCTRSTTLTYSARKSPQMMSTSKSYFKTICQRKLSTFVSTFASTRKRTRQKNSTLTRSRVGPSTTWIGLKTLYLRGNASACG